MWESVFPLGIRIATGLAAFAMTEVIWRDGRVVEGSGLENRRYASIRGFESHSLRHIAKATPCGCIFFFGMDICRVGFERQLLK